MLAPLLGASILGKAASRGLVRFNSVQLRDFAMDRHRSVDDTPYGGGEGMLLRADVLERAWLSVQDPSLLPEKCLTILLSPQGRVLTQTVAKELQAYSKIILICGHYEGVDERFIDRRVDLEISIGDYVLTGGEWAAGVLIDAVTRLIPGVVGNKDSLSEESLEGGLLKYPQYTRPPVFEGVPVPEVLTSGNHARIAKWRSEQRLSRTQAKRPDLRSDLSSKKGRK